MSEMSVEVAACPMPSCGRDDEVTEEGVFCICGYRLDDELEGMEDEPGVTTFERHNALARPAEIGRLVEQLTDACRVVPMVGKGEDLLTELRARVKEMNGDD